MIGCCEPRGILVEKHKQSPTKSPFDQKGTFLAIVPKIVLVLELVPGLEFFWKLVKSKYAECQLGPETTPIEAWAEGRSNGRRVSG